MDIHEAGCLKIHHFMPTTEELLPDILTERFLKLHFPGDGVQKSLQSG